MNAGYSLPFTARHRTKSPTQRRYQQDHHLYTRNKYVLSHRIYMPLLLIPVSISTIPVLPSSSVRLKAAPAAVATIRVGTQIGTELNFPWQHWRTTKPTTESGSRRRTFHYSILSNNSGGERQNDQIPLFLVLLDWLSVCEQKSMCCSSVFVIKFRPLESTSP